MSDDKRGDAVADKQREKFLKGRQESALALTELDVRAELKSMGEEETTDVIQREALERQRKKESDPPKAGPLQVIVIVARKFPPWGAVIVAVVAIAAYVYLKTR